MVKNYLPRGYHSFIWLLSIFIVSITFSILAIGGTASADNRGPWNQPEQNAYNQCWWGAGTQHGPRGAIWFTNGGYYDANVYIDSQQSNVTVAIRGSVYGCERGRTGHVYAVNVRPDGGNAGLLTGLSSSTLYRGYMPSPAARNWSSQGGDIYANLNVGWIPQNNTTSPQAHYFQVGLYRCFNQNGANGSCYTEMINVTVIRAGRPIQWTVNGQTYIGKGRIQDSNRRTDANYRPSQGGVQTVIGATPGETVHWNHLMRNNGPDATNRNLQVNIDKLTFDVGTFNNRGGNTGFTIPGWTNSPTRVGALIFEAYQHPPSYMNRYNHVVTQNDVGKRVCQRVAWNPGSSSYNDWRWASGGNGSWETGGYDCADVPFNYNIYPSVTTGDSGSLVDGGTATLEPRVINHGPTKANGPVQSTMYEFVIPAGQTISTNDFQARFDQVYNNRYRYHQGMTYPQNQQAACGTVTSWYGSRVKSGSCRALNGDGSGSGDIAIDNGSGSYGDATSVVNGSDYDPGDRVCRFLVIRNISNTETNSTTRRASVPTCLSIGKKPKVQVKSGNLSVGKVFEGIPNATSDPKVQTSLVTRTNAAPMIPVTSGSTTGAIRGLWKTGVNNNTQKAGQDVVDEHWNIDRVYSLVNAQTCQRAVTGAPNSTTLSAPQNVAARTVYENNGNTQAGRYIGSVDTGKGIGNNALAIVGNDPSQPVKDRNGNSPWGITSPGARWISQNIYGQHYTSTSCKDPTRDNLDYDSQLRAANVWVFKLKDGISIDRNVSLSSLRLRVTGAVDNRVKFFVNDCELRASSPTVEDNWQDPGFSSNTQKVVGAIASPVSTCADANGFHHGNNELEVHVASGYSHVGLLIDEFVIEGDMTQPSSSTFGSWVEYSIFAPSIVSRTASGSGLNIRSGVSSSLQSDWSRLTYANSGSCGTSNFGCYTHGDMTLPDPSLRYTDTTKNDPISGQVSVENLPQGVVTTSGPVTLSGGNMSRGKWTVINAPTADIHIVGNLTYESSALTNVNDLPQLVVIARNITIADNVREVNAWLVAKPSQDGSQGVINTCTGPGSAANVTPMTVNDCGQLLTVNGPVVSNRLILRRTAGSNNGDQQGDPAEVFNLRPDAYLWAYNQAGNGTNMRATSVRDLPPRW